MGLLLYYPTSGNKGANGGHQPVGKTLGGAKSSAALRGDVLRMQIYSEVMVHVKNCPGVVGIKRGNSWRENVYYWVLLSLSHFLPLSCPSWTKSPPVWWVRVRTTYTYPFTGVLPYSYSIVTSVRKSKPLHCVGTLFLLSGLHHDLY